MIHVIITIVITGIGLAGGSVLPQAQSQKPLLRVKTRCQRQEASSLFQKSLWSGSSSGNARAETLSLRGRELSGQSAPLRTSRKSAKASEVSVSSAGHSEFSGGRQLAKVSRDRLANLSCSGTPTCLSLSPKGAQAPCDFNSVILSLSPTSTSTSISKSTSASTSTATFTGI